MIDIEIAGLELNDLLTTPSRFARIAPKTQASKHKGPMVLIVEDDPAVSCSLEIRLRTHGYRVCKAFDATLAMDVAVRNRPDVAILDISLPGGSGFDVAERLKAEPSTSHVNVIFLTASHASELPARAYEVGADVFMTKPYSSSELIEEVGQLVPAAYEVE